MIFTVQIIFPQTESYQFNSNFNFRDPLKLLQRTFNFQQIQKQLLHPDLVKIFIFLLFIQ